MARRAKSGFWFDTKNFKLIEIFDHMIFLSELEAKVRFDLDLTAEDREHAKSLGMVVGQGWEKVPRETSAANKLRFMLMAFKRGWVRIRRHSDRPMAVFEFWKRSDDMMASLGVAVKLLKMPDTESVELHEVEKDKPLVITVGALKAIVKGEQADPEYRIYENPIAKGLHIRGNPFNHDEYASPGGAFSNPRCGAFTADSPAMCFGRRFKKMPKTVANPEEFDKYISPEKGEGPSVAQLFVGLTRGLGPHAKDTIKPSWVIEFVKARRKAQLPGRLPGGASFILQRGFFTDWKAQHLHPDEKSLQILVYPEFDGGETLRTFDKNMREMAMLVRREFDQKAVILNLVVDGKQSFLGEAKWKAEEGKKK